MTDGKKVVLRRPKETFLIESTRLTLRIFGERKKEETNKQRRVKIAVFTFKYLLNFKTGHIINVTIKFFNTPWSLMDILYLNHTLLSIKY